VLALGAIMAWVGPVMGTIQTMEEGTFSAPATVARAVVLGVFTFLYVHVVRAVMAGRRARAAVVAAGLIVLALLAATDTETLSWTTLGAAWAAVAVLGMSPSAAFLTGVATAVVVPIVAVRGVPEIPGLLLSATLCTMLPWSNRFQLWLWEVVRAAEQGRQARARLAVTEERLRFARDLHDLVGHSLTAIAVKSEVAVRLSETDVPRAAEEMTEVRGLAREALREIRTAVRGYRTVDLDAELRSVRDVLEAGGVRCLLDTERATEPDPASGGVPVEVPQDVSTLLAWVVREGATNVLRHSRASLCRIGLTVRDGKAVLEMRNDGADQSPRPSAPAIAGGDEERGIGLAGLAERVASAGGVLKAGPDGPGRFLLSAAVPIRGTA
jgi:two-component system sensor histidine kinase DesK